MAVPADVSADEKAKASKINEIIEYVETGHSHDGTDGAKITQYQVDTQVYSTSSSPIVYTELDLSGVVGSKVSMVLLYAGTTNGAFSIAFKPKGFLLRGTRDQDLAFNPISANSASFFWVMTDAAGKVDWLTSNNQQAFVRVAGYM